MSAKIYDFPAVLDEDPDPFQPDSAVRAYLAHNKSNATMRARIPEALMNYLQKQAFVSDQTLSRHCCRLLVSAVLRQRESGLHCPRMSGKKEAA